MHPALTDVAYYAARGLPPAHAHAHAQHGTSHCALSPVTGDERAKAKASPRPTTMRRKSGIKGDTSHHVLCVVTRAPLLLCLLLLLLLLPNSTSAAQASQTMNHVPPRCPLEQQPSLCILMSLHQKVTSQGGSQAIRRLPAPSQSRLSQGGEN